MILVLIRLILVRMCSAEYKFILENADSFPAGSVKIRIEEGGQNQLIWSKLLKYHLFLFIKFPIETTRQNSYSNDKKIQHVWTCK
jgi:hypothetical protein